MSWPRGIRALLPTPAPRPSSLLPVRAPPPPTLSLLSPSPCWQQKQRQTLECPRSQARASLLSVQEKVGKRGQRQEVVQGEWQGKG